MDLNAEGRVFFEGSRVMHAVKLEELAAAIGGPAGDEAARLVSFFGPAANRDLGIIDLLDLDLSRSFLGSLSYQWTRPFVADEQVGVRVHVEALRAASGHRSAVVLTEVRDLSGGHVQSHRATFIEQDASR